MGRRILHVSYVEADVAKTFSVSICSASCCNSSSFTNTCRVQADRYAVSVVLSLVFVKSRAMPVFSSNSCGRHAE
jgi:hypothetical protein